MPGCPKGKRIINQLIFIMLCLSNHFFAKSEARKKENIAVQLWWKQLYQVHRQSSVLNNNYKTDYNE